MVNDEKREEQRVCLLISEIMGRFWGEDYEEDFWGEEIFMK